MTTRLDSHNNPQTVLFTTQEQIHQDQNQHPMTYGPDTSLFFPGNDLFSTPLLLPTWPAMNHVENSIHYPEDFVSGNLWYLSGPILSTVADQQAAMQTLYQPEQNNIAIRPTHDSPQWPLQGMTNESYKTTSLTPQRSAARHFATPVSTDACDQKLYSCRHCERTFARRHDLNRHTRVHTGAKPYICPCCFKPFARSDARGRHFRNEASCRYGQRLLDAIKEMHWYF